MKELIDPWWSTDINVLCAIRHFYPFILLFPILNSNFGVVLFALDVCVCLSSRCFFYFFLFATRKSVMAWSVYWMRI